MPKLLDALKLKRNQCMTEPSIPKQPVIPALEAPNKLSNTVCIKTCSECGLTEKVSCCLNCAFRDGLRQFPSFNGIAEDDWRGRMFAKPDTIAFYCRQDKVVHERKIPVINLPQVCQDWKPRFYRETLTGNVREKISIGGEI